MSDDEDFVGSDEDAGAVIAVSDDDEADGDADRSALGPKDAKSAVRATVEDEMGAPEGADAGGSAKKRKASAKIASEAKLVVGKTVKRNMLIFETPDTQIDLSGDIGTVGRFKCDGNTLMLDLKGIGSSVFASIQCNMYSGKLASCVTGILVSVSGTDAKIEAVANEYVPLRLLGNVFDKEASVEGAIDDALFNADDDG